MNSLLRITAVVMLVHLGLGTAGRAARADQRDLNQDRVRGEEDLLNLADLAGYRAALSGRATADDARPSDPPAPVRFRDLWERSGDFQGRRVTVRGRVERIFRQGPVGSFPPLAELWITSEAGDPFCLVFPLPQATAGDSPNHDPAAQPAADSGPATRASPPHVPELGRTVRFTGTFLKLVQYAASDGARLAPLIVGDRPPASAPAQAGDGESPSSRAGEVLRAIGGHDPNGGAGSHPWNWSPSSWALGLVLAISVGGVLAWQHLRGAARRGPSAIPSQRPDDPKAGPPLHFVDSKDDTPL
jgi:hypothetical protein